MKAGAFCSFFVAQAIIGSRSIMQRGFLNSSDGIFGAAGRKRKSPPAASSGSSSSGPGPVSGADKKDAAADGQGGASSSGADGQGGASSSGADGGFGPYSKEQVQHFVLQLKHMDMLGIDTYVTDNGAIFGREELRDIIKRFDR